MNTSEVRAALYYRLSCEDDDTPTQHSESIATQKMIVEDYCVKQGFRVVDTYIDDGISGTTFARPAFQRLLNDIERGRVNTVICKDLSRIGRSYEVESYLEGYFPERGVRFIAVNDNVDSDNGEYDISVSIRNLLNSEYPKDISRKTKNALEARALKGLYLGSKAPYGYAKDPSDKNHLVVDEEAAAIVRQIFQWAAGGWGYNRIAATLRNMQVVTPAEYARRHGNPEYLIADKKQGMEFCWHVTSVEAILRNPVYCGSCVHGRRGNRKMHGKQLKRAKEDWIVIEGTHEPLVSREVWGQIQERIAVRRRSCADGTPQMFAGLLFCADCGSALSFTRIRRKTMPDTGKYRCWFALRHGKDICTPHTIYLHELEQAVLADIREYASLSAINRAKLVDMLMVATSRDEARTDGIQETTYNNNIARLAEIDAIFRNAFEKNAMGIIDDDQFISLNAAYRRERDELTAWNASYKEASAKHNQITNDIETFADLVARYTNIKELNADVLNALIRRIEVHEPIVDADGTRRQKIEIYYRFAGRISDGSNSDHP